MHGHKRITARQCRLATGVSIIALSALLVALPPIVQWPAGPSSLTGYAFADDGGDGGGGSDGGGDDGGSDDSGSDDGGSDDSGGDDSGSGESGSDDSGEDGESGEGGESGDDDGGGSDDSARSSEVERRAMAGELVVIDGPQDFDAQAAALGFVVIDHRELASLGISVTRVQVPRGLSLNEGEARLRDAFPGIAIADNAIYAPGGQIALPTPDYARDLVGWAPGALDCARGLRIGLIDSRVDAAAPGLGGLQIATRSFLPAGVPEAPSAHGTAIAEIIAGDGGGMAPLIAAPSLYNAAIFERLADGTPGASAVGLAEALDWLVAESVPLANISLAGARNPLIEIAIDRAHARGLLMIAAVGNGGPDAGLAWPAAHPAVVAVTAIGPDAALYAQAARGTAVDFAAPGVSVWSGGVDGSGRFDSGTSFAVQFVTAAAAAWLGQGGAADAAAFNAAFAPSAADLGASGPDPDFGNGLISLDGACAGGATP